MHKPDNHDDIRDKARRFEAALPKEQRKRLGQFFTGIPLGKLLANLALTTAARTVLDPMAGHGALLDAASEVAHERGQLLSRLDGIEIDASTAELCRERLGSIFPESHALRHGVVSGDAFSLSAISSLPQHSYDIAITNPPYVRYQSYDGHQSVRGGLTSIIEATMDGHERTLWLALANGYSGLADMSIPASMLAALLVAREGRIALVLPATWRSREYGDVLRYLLLRCFQLEYIVEDTQPGWFSTALVRTNLVVARRLSPDESAVPLGRRTPAPPARFVQIGPEAADAISLVGAAFGTVLPEMEMAQWLAQDAHEGRSGLKVRPFCLESEWNGLRTRIARRAWFQSVEPDNTSLPLFSAGSHHSIVLPDALRGLVPEKEELRSLSTLQANGIRVGQGLRTGCNSFFYVDALDGASKGMMRVKSSSAFSHREFLVPHTALRPVLRRQSELAAFEADEALSGYVLDLRQWILPEDTENVARAAETYRTLGQPIPQVMPESLAAYVRDAAETTPNDKSDKRVPELSAVRTNVRPHKPGAAPPRFWYMLPDFMPRHQPAAFVPRINHGAPWIECANESDILIDANFSTFWTTDGRWTRFALKALLNSAWCQLFMEALGTPMGGGALKLEAVQISQLPLPLFSEPHRRQLDEAGHGLKRNGPTALADVDAIVLAALQKMHADYRGDFVAALADRTESLRQMRLRNAA